MLFHCTYYQSHLSLYELRALNHASHLCLNLLICEANPPQNLPTHHSHRDPSPNDPRDHPTSHWHQYDQLCSFMHLSLSDQHLNYHLSQQWL